MKKILVFGVLTMLFVLPLSAQNITNTLGPGGKFTIKDLTKTFFTLRQFNGNVGIGTSTPISKLHVITGAADVSPRLQSSGTSGFAAGWDFYQGAVGKGYVGVPDLGASFGSGELLLFGGVGTKVSLWANQARAVTIATSGNVGIGTTAPIAKLEVRGDIRLGSSGQYRATSGQENLRIIRGSVDGPTGNIEKGADFTSQRLATGKYLITFTPSFASAPCVTGSAHRPVSTSVQIGVTTAPFGATASNVILRVSEGVGHSVNYSFDFIAIGPR